MNTSFEKRCHFYGVFRYKFYFQLTSQPNLNWWIYIEVAFYCHIITDVLTV